MADGGRNAYRGLRYQYLRTLEALMAAVEEPALGISAVHIEGMPGRDGADRDSVDYELSDANGRVVEAVQVKKRAMKKTMGASDAFRALSGWSRIRKRTVTRYKSAPGPASPSRAWRQCLNLLKIPLPKGVYRCGSRLRGPAGRARRNA